MTMRKAAEVNATPVRQRQQQGKSRDHPSRALAAKRKHGWRAVAAAAALLAVSGCSTPGPLHLYAIAPGAETIHDVAVDANDATQPTPSYLNSGDVLTGFGYDPFTDHLFLRLAPGNHIRVVDRPARKIKREFDIEGGPNDVGLGAGDIAVSPRDGHLYLVDSEGPDLIETTRLARFVRRVPLQGRTTPAAAVAFDMSGNRLLVLNRDGQTIERYTTNGERAGEWRLAQRVAPSLAFDAHQQHLYAPLSDSPQTVGVFDGEGRLVRTVPIPPGDTFIDVGPHSFLRVF